MREALIESFHAAVAAADPLKVVAEALPAPSGGRNCVVGAGKASAQMALALERAWLGPGVALAVPNEVGAAAARGTEPVRIAGGGTLEGLVVTRYGHAAPCAAVRIVEAAHPVPDAAGHQAAARMLALAAGVGEGDLLIALISGGGSALLTLPVEGVSLASVRQLTGQLLASGAPIEAMNIVRKHLSRIQGGQLARAAALRGASVCALIISDVTGDDPSAIASGPCAPDPSSFQDAVEVLAHWGVEPPPDVAAHLRAGARGEREETPKPGDPVFLGVSNRIIGAPARSLVRAAEFWQARGVRPVILGDTICGEASQVALVMAALVREALGGRNPGFQPPLVFLSGGECTVTLAASSARRGQAPARGGRCSEFLLALLQALGPQDRVWALAADTDGIDGSQDNAGALFDPGTFGRARAAGVDTREHLRQHDAWGFFFASGDLVHTGPTLTNVNDYRAIVVLPRAS